MIVKEIYVIADVSVKDFDMTDICHEVADNGAWTDTVEKAKSLCEIDNDEAKEKETNEEFWIFKLTAERIK